MPSVAGEIDLGVIAKGCGYLRTVTVDNFEELDVELEATKLRSELSLIEIKCSIMSRENLGRPTIGTLENKKEFMNTLV